MKTKEYFDSTAKMYDESNDGKFVRCMYPEVVKAAKEAPGKRILDIGCGNGNVLRFLMDQRQGDYYGVDLSEKMIEEARKRLPGDVVLKPADVVSLPFEDAFFDILICNASFHHYEEPEKAIGEMKRVLKPGGTLILGDPTFPLFRRVFNWLIKWGNAGDVWIYGKKDILPLFEREGFDILKWKRLNFISFVFQARRREKDEEK